VPISTQNSEQIITKTDTSGNYNYTFTSPSTVGTYEVKVNSTYNSEYGETNQTLTVTNAPDVTSISITPTAPNTSSTLSCYATANDAVISSLTVEWFWYNLTSSGYQLKFSGNTSGISRGVNSLITTLGDGNTTKGETWNCTVRAYNGGMYSNYDSSTVTIINTPPTQDTPIITPISPNTSSTLSCNATATDAENTTLNVEYFWYNLTASGYQFVLGGNTSVTSNENTVITTLGSGNTTKGETWNCTIRAFDGTAYSSYNSSTIIISNAPPTHDTPSITPTNPNTDSNLTCNWNNVQDIDGDAVQNITNWYKNNKSITLLYLPFEGGSNSTYTKDYSGWNRVVSVINSLWNLTFGKIGGAYKFVNNTNLINISGNFNSTRLTTEFWFKPEQNYTNYSTRGTLLKSDNYEIFMKNGSIYFSYNHNDAKSISDIWNINNWYYLYGIVNSTHVKLYINGSLQQSTLLEDPFAIENSLNQTTSLFYYNGDIVLRGSCFTSVDCLDPGDDSYTILDSNSQVVAYINQTGHMCIEDTSCSDNDQNCNNPGDNAFVIEDNNGRIVSYINATGSLCMIGDLEQNVNP
jgi:hypothetical protein